LGFDGGPTGSALEKNRAIHGKETKLKKPLRLICSSAIACAMTAALSTVPAHAAGLTSDNLRLGGKTAITPRDIQGGGTFGVVISKKFKLPAGAVNMLMFGTVRMAIDGKGDADDPVYSLLVDTTNPQPMVWHIS
jgi:hypothetical protein